MLPAVVASDASLITPELGLSIWTLVTFLIVLFVLKKFAFGKIAALLDERRDAVRKNLEAAEHAREEAERLLGEYKTQLAASRQEASEMLERRPPSSSVSSARSWPASASGVSPPRSRQSPQRRSRRWIASRTRSRT